jgi:hypothetical protein
VSELSRCVDMDIKPSLAELLDTFLNKDEVEKLIKSPVILNEFLQLELE